MSALRQVPARDAGRCRVAQGTTARFEPVRVGRVAMAHVEPVRVGRVATAGVEPVPIRRGRLASIVVSALLLAATTSPEAVAQVPAAAAAPEFLTAAPDAPAFTFLSANPGQIQRPGTLRDLGVALLSGVGPDGTVQQGFSLDASVWTLVPGLTIDLRSYQGSVLSYMLANTQVSLATARAAGSGDAGGATAPAADGTGPGDTNAALGLHITVLDRSDPMRDPVFTDSLGTASLRCLPDEAGPDGADPATVQACVDSVTAAAFAAYTSRNWNRPRLSIAAAAGSFVPGSQTDRARWGGGDVWAVGSLPLTSRGELIGQARFSQRPALDTIPSYRALDLGARVVFGTGTFNLFAEVVSESRSYADSPRPPGDRSPSSWSGGVEFRVGEGMWMTTGFGNRYSGLGDPDKTLVFGHIRWSVVSGARMAGLR